MVRAKVGTEEYQERVELALREKGVPCTANDVAIAVGIGFSTARALLFELVVDDKVEIIETCRTPLFRLRSQSKGEVNGSASNS